MAVRLSGDFDRLERLIGRAGKVAAPGFRRELLDSMANEINRQIGLGFRLSQDPFGRPWEPLKTRAGRPLVKSGTLQRAAQSATPTPSGVMVQIDLIYAATQNFGARIRAKNAKMLRFKVGRRWVFTKSVTIPARSFLPGGELPPRWRVDLAQVVTIALSRTLRG